MYYEEKIIDGVLSWRGSPNEDFKPFTPKQLTEKITALKEELSNLSTAYESVCQGDN